MKVLYCGYRSWALDIYEPLRKDLPKWDFTLVKTPEEFHQKMNSDKFDTIVCVGWSWILKPDIIVSTPSVAIHPSDLPEYAGGSPLQHQIIDGVTHTKASLFRLNEKIDAGPVVAQVDLDLSGHMSQIFSRLAHASERLVKIYLNGFPENITKANIQNSDIKARKRLTIKDGELTPEKLNSMTCKQLFDFIRCREAPYPNVYMEDETGKIYFPTAEFEPKN